MKILYDHQIFSMQKYGGISRYFYELISNLKTCGDIHCELGCKYTGNSYLESGGYVRHQSIGKSTDDFLWGISFAGKAKIHRALGRIGFVDHPVLINEKYSIDMIQKGSFDIFHPTYYDRYFYKHLKGKPFVLTIYDMIHELYAGKYFPKHGSVMSSKKFLSQRADKIITISQNTKKDLIELYGIDEKKISVIYLATSLKCDGDIARHDLPGKYILFIGDRQNYKNFKLFLKAAAPVLNEDKDLYLVCGGSTFFDSHEMALIRDLDLDGKVMHKAIRNDDILTGLYKNAIAFFFPSLYEGFGIPVLEAFACGCPAVISNRSSLPEVGGEAAYYFDPESVESIGSAVEKIVHSSTLRDELIHKGFERSKEFSWSETARDTYKVYENICE